MPGLLTPILSILSPPAPPAPPSPAGSLLSLSVGVGPLTVANNATVNGTGNDTIVGGNGDTINLSGGGNNVSVQDQSSISIIGFGNSVSAHDHASINVAGGGDSVTMHDSGSLTIAGGGNNITLHDKDSVTINDARSESDGFAGSVNFGDTISAHNNDTIALNYTLNLGNSDNVSVVFQPNVTDQPGGNSTATPNNLINAGDADTINFAGAGEAIRLNAGGNNVLTTTGANDTITIGNSATANSSASTGGACSNGIILTVGATAAGTTFNGGLGTDTFTAGAGYDGGNHYIGSLGTQAELFSAGNCVNYSGLDCRVTVNYNTGVGQAFDASGNLLWTDTYTNVEQVKAAELNGNVLIGSNAYFNELKGGLGQTTYYDGAGGDRIIWGEAGTTGLLDGQGTDIAYLGNGTDELYWRNQPQNSKGVSNFGETAYGFNTAQGDTLNFTELATSGFAGVGNAFNTGDTNILNWVNVSLAGNGQDTDVWFDKSGSGNFSQVAVVLKNDNLFSQYGAATGASGAAQVVQDLYSAGHIVLNLTH
ncbi:MAG TPA: hypothetical protein VMB84_18095 [Stellaceae bacterium]|nr:hypothetical protein [Stellaceae bacterium]